MGWLWHRRLGHVGMKQLNKLIKHDLVRGLKDVTFEKDKLCSACQARKQVGNTHSKKSMMSTSKAFELVHIDLFGPTTYTSIGGNKYGFVIMDDFTRYTVYTRIWKKDFKGSKAPKTMSTRDQLRVDRKQLIRMQH